MKYGKKRAVLAWGILGCVSSASADVIGAVASGGKAAYSAVCYVTNAGAGPVKILSAKLLKEDGTERSSSPGGCSGDLAAGATCHVITFPLQGPLGDATFCKVDVSTNGQKVLGEIELRAKDGTILNSINLH